jgi:hypothetical protein
LDLEEEENRKEKKRKEKLGFWSIMSRNLPRHCLTLLCASEVVFANRLPLCPCKLPCIMTISQKYVTLLYTLVTLLINMYIKHNRN